MSDLVASIATLVVLAAGISVMVGGGRALKSLVRLGARLGIVLIAVAVLLPSLKSGMTTAGTRAELGYWLAVAVGAVILLFWGLFGTRAFQQLLGRLFASFIYDVLKNTVLLVLGGFKRLLQLVK